MYIQKTLNDWSKSLFKLNTNSLFFFVVVRHREWESCSFSAEVVLCLWLCREWASVFLGYRRGSVGGSERGGVYLEVTSGAGEERECWDWGLAEGVGGWAGLLLRLPLVPDWAICCWSCEIMSSSFSLASRSLQSSSCSSCRSASARSKRQRSSHSCGRNVRGVTYRKAQNIPYNKNMSKSTAPFWEKNRAAQF